MHVKPEIVKIFFYIEKNKKLSAILLVDGKINSFWRQQFKATGEKIELIDFQK